LGPPTGPSRFLCDLATFLGRQFVGPGLANFEPATQRAGRRLDLIDGGLRLGTSFLHDGAAKVLGSAGRFFLDRSCTREE